MLDKEILDKEMLDKEMLNKEKERRKRGKKEKIKIIFTNCAYIILKPQQALILLVKKGKQLL